jgi:hypothetical protein
MPAGAAADRIAIRLVRARTDARTRNHAEMVTPPRWILSSPGPATHYVENLVEAIESGSTIVQKIVMCMRITDLPPGNSQAGGHGSITTKRCSTKAHSALSNYLHRPSTNTYPSCLRSYRGATHTACARGGTSQRPGVQTYALPS